MCWMQVAPLTDVQISHMDEIFHEEIGCWQRELHWDFGPSAEMIGRYIKSRHLPGYVLYGDAGAPAGYVYYIANKPVGFIGDLFVRKSQASTRAYKLLLERAFRSLTVWPQVRRIECQIFPFNTELLPLFKRLGFRAIKRRFLILPLQVEGAFDEIEPKPLPCRITRWHRNFLEGAASVIYESYIESPDHDMCFDYQSKEGCTRFLANLLDNPGCGTFREDTSLLALDDAKEVCAVLLTSEISSGTGMIPQISVRSDWQGQGIGTQLLIRYLQEARKQGLERIALSVSDANRGAYRLYRRLGFEDSKTFHAYIWDN